MLGLTSEVKIKVNSEKDCLKNISVELANSIVQEKIQKAFESIRAQAKLPGFRPGKAPIEQVKESYKDLAYERAQESLLQHGVTEAIKSKKIQPVQTPIVQKVSFSPEKPFQFDFEVEVAPEFKPSNYKGLKLNKNVNPVKEEDVNKALENIANMNARLIESKSESLSTTDFAVIDYTGYLDDKAIEGAHAENFLMDMSAPQAISGLAEGLVGAKPGENREIKVKFPENSPSQELAGKEAVFKVKLTAIKEKKLPNIDDEFAKDLGLESLTVLKEKVNENLEKERQRTTQADLEKQVMDRLLEGNSFGLPPTVVKEQADHLMQRQKERMKEQGYQDGDIEKMTDRFKPDVQKEAERQVRLAYILGAVGDAESISVTDEDINGHIEKILSQSQPQERGPMEKALKGAYRDRLRSELRESKIFEWLISQAKVKEVSSSS